MALNAVVAGDYRHYTARFTFGGFVLAAPLKAKVKVNRNTVDGYEVMNEESKTSTASALIRGGLGVAILGPLGGLAALGARKKGTFHVAVQFKDGKRSLLELDDLQYKSLMKELF